MMEDEEAELDGHGVGKLFELWERNSVRVAFSILFLFFLFFSFI